MEGPAAEQARFDVAISGASYAGLALARGLVQAFGPDLRIALIDRSSPNLAGGPSRDRRAFAIWAGAKTALESLGVWPDLAPEAVAVSSIEISDSAVDDGIRQTRLTYDAHTPDGQPAVYMVAAQSLLRALLGSLAGAASVTWFSGVEAIDVDLTPELARVALADGRQISASLVVAADGRSSTLRDCAGIKTIGWDYDQVGIVAPVKFSEPHDGVAIQHFFPGGPFAILPLGTNRACITWSCGSAEARHILALNEQDFLAELDKRIAGRFGVVELDGPHQSWPLAVRMPRSLIARRFVLAGDAAHGVHPIAGQGVNLALRDASALIEVLADAARLGLDLGNGTHLERYQRWRRFDASMSASAYDGLNRLFAVDNIVLRAGRGAALGLLDQWSEAKRYVMAEAAGVTGDLPKLMRGEAV